MSEKLLSPITGLSESKLALATAIASDVLSGKTFYSGDKELKTGTMTNRGAWGTTVAAGGSITIPAGYHNGSGRVTATYGSSSISAYGGSVTASAAGWYVGIAAAGRTKNDYNPDPSYSTNGSSVTVHAKVSTGNDKGGYGYLVMSVYLAVGQYLSLSTGGGTYANSNIIYMGR